MDFTTGTVKRLSQINGTYKLMYVYTFYQQNQFKKSKTAIGFMPMLLQDSNDIRHVRAPHLASPPLKISMQASPLILSGRNEGPAT